MIKVERLVLVVYNLYMSYGVNIGSQDRYDIRMGVIETSEVSAVLHINPSEAEV